MKLKISLTAIIVLLVTTFSIAQDYEFRIVDKGQVTLENGDRRTLMGVEVQPISSIAPVKGDILTNFVAYVSYNTNYGFEGVERVGSTYKSTQANLKPSATIFNNAFVGGFNIKSIPSIWAQNSVRAISVTPNVLSVLKEDLVPGQWTELTEIVSEQSNAKAVDFQTIDYNTLFMTNAPRFARPAFNFYNVGKSQKIATSRINTIGVDEEFFGNTSKVIAWFRNSEELTVKIENSEAFENVDVMVYDLTGAVLVDEKGVNLTDELVLSGSFNTGVYTVAVIDQDSKERKFVKVTNVR